MKRTSKTLDCIYPLDMNGMHGRMLRLAPPAGKTREILMIYGHHASLERMIGLAEELNKYGGVTMPDLPGFGGMDSFYKIGEKPTLDNLADYLASFIKLRFKRGRISISGMSFGFIVVTRMLQKYPELAKRVDLLISTVGFVHRDDFKFKPSTFWVMRTGAAVFSRRLSSWWVRHFILRGVFIRMTYLLVADRHVKLRDADQEERNKRIDFEIGLWQCNDVRTYMFTTIVMLTLDLCNKTVPLPVYHVNVEPDRYFDNTRVELHMRRIFTDFHAMRTKVAGHAPTVVADAKSASPFVPSKLRRLLAHS